MADSDIYFNNYSLDHVAVAHINHVDLDVAIQSVDYMNHFIWALKYINFAVDNSIGQVNTDFFQPNFDMVGIISMCLVINTDQAQDFSSTATALVELHSPHFKEPKQIIMTYQSCLLQIYSTD